MFSVHPNSEPSEWFKKKKYMYEYMRERKSGRGERRVKGLKKERGEEEKGRRGNKRREKEKSYANYLIKYNKLSPN